MQNNPMVDLKVEQQPFAHLERNRVTFRNMTLIEDSYLPLPVVKHRHKSNFRDTQNISKIIRKNLRRFAGFLRRFGGFLRRFEKSVFSCYLLKCQHHMELGPLIRPSFVKFNKGIRNLQLLKSSDVPNWLRQLCLCPW